MTIINHFDLLLITVVLQDVVKVVNTRTLLEQEVLKSVCPQLFLNCSVTDLPGSALQWFFDDSVVALYEYSHDHQYPFNVEPNHMWSDLVVHVLSASLSEDDHDYLNVESTLMANISTLREHGVINITCGGFGTKSNIITPNLTATTFPPSPSTSCSLLFPSGGPEVTLQWSPSFISQHAVERYRVAVNPDPSSCSSDQVNPNEDYSCSALSLGTNYSITVSAISCGDQEGTRNTFTVWPQGVSSVVISVTVNRALLIAGVITELVAISCCIITVIFNVVKYNQERITKSRHIFITILVFFLTSAIFVLVSLLLWIVTGAVLEQHTNTCDSTWLSGADALIVSAFLVSLIAFLSALGTLTLIIFHKQIQICNTPEITIDRESCRNVAPTSDSLERYTPCAVKNCRKELDGMIDSVYSTIEAHPHEENNSKQELDGVMIDSEYSMVTSEQLISQETSETLHISVENDNSRQFEAEKKT